MVLQVDTKVQIATKLTVMLLCSEEDEEQAIAQSLMDISETKMRNVHVFDSFNGLYLPDLPLKHAVVDISCVLLINITTEVVKIDPLKIINDYRRRQHPRFR